MPCWAIIILLRLLIALLLRVRGWRTPEECNYGTTMIALLCLIMQARH